MLKRNWKFIDDHVAKSTKSHGETFDKLTSYLDEPIHSSPDRNIYMARAILQWLRKASKFDGPYKKDNPNEIASKLFSQKLSFAIGYKKLCDAAGVQCEVVTGINKAGHHQPGDIKVERDQMEAKWNKVFLQGKWWPVNPRWILRSVSPDGGKAEIGFNEFWFLTDPEIFIQKCYPDDKDDQMLPEAKIVKTPRHFMKLPYLTPVFFRNNLRLTSESQSVVEAIDGECRISFKAENNTIGKNFVCQFAKEHLEITDRKGNNFSDLKAALKGANVADLVFCSRKKSHFMFDIRCPTEGYYNLTIHGGPMGEPEKVLMKVRVLCREVMEDFLPFPGRPGKVGWGFGPVAREAGLAKTDKKEPRLLIDESPDKPLTIKFDLDSASGKSSDYIAELSSVNKKPDDLKDNVSVQKDSKTLTVEVKSPGEGEYNLAVLAKSSKDKAFKPVCHYMLTNKITKQKIEDEYYDSSDGTSDIDVEIEDLQTKLQALNEKKLKLEQLVKAKGAK